MEGLQGKTAIVTGGSSGIGQAIAIRLGHEGVNVAVNYVGAMEGAVATSEAIEAGVHACIAEINECRAPSRALLVEADVHGWYAVCGRLGWPRPASRARTIAWARSATWSLVKTFDT